MNEVNEERLRECQTELARLLQMHTNVRHVDGALLLAGPHKTRAYFDIETSIAENLPLLVIEGWPAEEADAPCAVDHVRPRTRASYPEMMQSLADDILQIHRRPHLHEAICMHGARNSFVIGQLCGGCGRWMQKFRREKATPRCRSCGYQP